MSKESKSAGSTSLKERFLTRWDMPKNIRHLASGLVAKPDELDAVIKDFDRGDTLLRDATGLTLNKRNLILELGPKNPFLLPPHIKEVYEETVGNLAECMNDRVNFRKAAGWIFLRDALGYPVDGRNAVSGLNECLMEEYSWSIQNFVDGYRTRPGKVGQFIAEVAENPKYTSRLAYFLAYRTQIYEREQERDYGRLLQQVKGKIGKTVYQLAIETGLPDAYLNRAFAQLDRTCFSVRDPIRKITLQETGFCGYYSDNTLRIEKLIEGNPEPASRTSENETRDTLIHENFHSISAQFKARCGLKISRQSGEKVNEGMTTYLTEVTQNFPNFYREQPLFGDSFHVVYNSLPIETATMHDLRVHHPKDFVPLFNAYFGYAQTNLPDALDQYYSMLYEREDRFWEKSRYKVDK